mgnify:FL=1
MAIYNLNDIDTKFDFTSDTPNYWDGFWNNDLGHSAKDPDSKSQTLRDYHCLLWSRQLPCGDIMELMDGKSKYYLKWKDMYFGSDSILVSFRHADKSGILSEVRNKVDNYRDFVEKYMRDFYSIGGMIIFPQHRFSLNCARGCNKRICDRWDLTLECIRRFYQGIESPLSKSLNRDKDFFNLFVDFKGYVDFFFLQDCVDEDYTHVNLWLGSEYFERNPFPHNAEEYLSWINKEYDFLKKRNLRIMKFCHSSSVHKA